MKNQLSGVVTDILLETPQRCVLRIKEGKTTRRVVGKFESLQIGHQVTFKGVWETNSQYGRQFMATDYDVIIPERKAGVVYYLQSGFIKGIGPVLAEQLYDIFGEDVLNAVEHQPMKLTVVPGITSDKINEIRISHMENKKYAGIVCMLGSFATPKLTLAIYSRYEEDSVNVLSENPYQLIDDIVGIGFLKADRIAQCCGIEYNHPKRISAGIIHELRQISKEGHCFTHFENLYENTRKRLNYNFSKEIFYREIECLKLEEKVVIDGDNVYLKLIYDCECEIAHHLCRLNHALPNRVVKEYWTKNAIFEIESRLGFKFEEDQKTVVYSVFQNMVFLLTGGPGSGKTTVINAILEAWRSKETVLLTAHVGRAAKRMSEVTNYPACTIFKALDYSYVDGKMDFAYNEKNPMPYDLVIVDETTVLDIFIFRSLLRAIRTGTRVVFIGDKDQLPSITAGNVFRDLLLCSCFSSVRLSVSHRYTGSIANNCKKISDGFGVHTFDQSTSQFIYYAMKTKTMQQKVVDEYIGIAKTYGIDNVACITGVNDKNSVSVAALNQLIRTEINPPAGRIGIETSGNAFYEGDRVIQNINNYNKGVFNGDVGCVQSVDPGGKKCIIQFDDGKVIAYTQSEMRQMSLAYAINVHKSMGSEYQAVVIAHFLPPILYDKSFTYTAVSRAKEKLILIGDSFIINKCIGTIRKRNTKLIERIQEYK